ncbi:ribonuclease III, partial [Staphylococcus aureus]
KLKKEGGPEPNFLFTSEVKLQGEAIAEGKGKTKKESEQRDAESAYKQLKQIK